RAHVQFGRASLAGGVRGETRHPESGSVWSSDVGGVRHGAGPLSRVPIVGAPVPGALDDAWLVDNRFGRGADGEVRFAGLVQPCDNKVPVSGSGKGHGYSSFR